MSKKKMKTGYKVLISALCAIILLGAIGVSVFAYFMGGLKTKKLNATPEELGIVTPTKAPTTQTTTTTTTATPAPTEEPVKKEIRNIALFGVDSRKNTFTGRSDTIMILSIDGIDNKVKMTSIARDTYCKVEGHGYTKLTHAYAYGGPKLAIKTLNQNFNLNIMDYATTNFGDFADIVDMLGGVDIKLSSAEVKELKSRFKVDITANPDGKTHLNGEQAIAYTRIRYTDSDIVRTERQRTVMIEMFKKMQTKPKAEIPKFIRAIVPKVETTLPYEDIIKYVPFVLGKPDIGQAFVPDPKNNPKGGIYKGAWYFRYDLNKASDMIHKFIYDDIPFKEQ